MASQGLFLAERPPTGLIIAQTVGITASMYLLGELHNTLHNLKAADIVTLQAATQPSVS
jgi:hypothetical protein